MSEKRPRGRPRGSRSTPPDPHFQTLLKYTKHLAAGINKALGNTFVTATKHSCMLHNKIPGFSVINTSLVKFHKAVKYPYHAMKTFKKDRNVGEFIASELKTILETYTMTGEVWVLGSLSPMNSYISTKQLIKFGKQTIVDKLGKFLCVEGHSHDLPLSVRVSIPDFPKSAENYRNMRYATGRLEQLGEELKLGPVVVFDDSYGSGLSMIMVLEALRQLGYEEWFHNIHPIALVKEQK